MAVAVGSAIAALPAQGKEPAPAQDPAVRLRALLDELQRLDAKAWDEHCAALERLATEQEQRAAALQKEQQRLEQEAMTATTKAAALRKELQQLRALQQTLQTLPPGAPAAAMPATKEKAAPPPPSPPPQPGAATAPAPKQNAAQQLVLWQQVEPILADHCASCHDADSRKGGLDVTSLLAVLAGGGSGRSVVPGAPDQSRLYRMVAQQERPFMPKDNDPLPAPLVAVLRQWIEQGAAGTAEQAAAFQRARDAELLAAAAASPAASAAAASAGPLPVDLPRTVQTVPRAMPLVALARSATAPLLALAGFRQILLWSAPAAGAAPELLGALPVAATRTGPLAFATDGTLLAAGVGEAGRRGEVLVFDVATAQLLGAFGAERDVPLAVAVHRGQGLVALGGASRSARVVALDTGQERFAGKHDDFVLALAFAPDGALLAAADRSGRVALWQTTDGREHLGLAGHRGAVHALQFDAAGRHVFTACADGIVRCFAVADGKERWRASAHQGEALALAVSAAGAVASAGSDGRIAVHDGRGRQIARSAAVGEWLFCVAFGAGDGCVLAGDAQGRLHQFDVEPRRLRQLRPLQPAQ